MRRLLTTVGLVVVGSGLVPAGQAAAASPCVGLGGNAVCLDQAGGVTVPGHSVPVPSTVLPLPLPSSVDQPPLLLGGTPYVMTASPDCILGLPTGESAWLFRSGDAVLAQDPFSAVEAGRIYSERTTFDAERCLLGLTR